MRLCFVCDTYGSEHGGLEFVTFRWIEKLIEREHEIVVLSAKGINKKTHGIKVYEFDGVPLPKTQGLVRVALPTKHGVYKVLSKTGVDLIHIFLVPSLLSSWSISVGRLLKIPIVVSNHLQPENLFLNVNVKNKYFNQLFYKFTVKNYYNRSELVIGPSKFSIDVLKKHGLKARYKIISNGVDRSFFNEKVDGKIFLKMFGIDERTKKILFVGRLDREKRVDLLIKAFKKIKKDVPDTILIIVGRGSEFKKLANLVKNLKLQEDVLFTGYLSNEVLASAYAACDVFASASEVELQGLIFLEAMSAGKPVVGQRVCAIPELIIDGLNGYTFERGNQEELANKIIKLLLDEDLRKKFSRNSIRLAKKHGIEKSIKELEETYASLVE